MRYGKRWIVALLALALLTGVVPGIAAATTPEETPHVPFNAFFYNPIKVDFMLGDPWLICHEGAYYYTESGGTKVSVMRSPTISGLMGQKDFMKNVYLGFENNQTQLWASELHFYQDRWYAFYAADFDNNNTLHRMYTLRSLTPDAMGDWEYVGKLDLPEDQWAIDGTFFENADGRIFHIWSGWKNEGQGTSLWKQYLYIAELTPGDPTQVLSTERVMISKPEHYWEQSVLPQNEGPAILLSPAGTVYCVYAANYSGSDDYALGALRLVGEDPMRADAWEKLPEPILASRPENQVYAPGHASFTKSPDGTEDWVIYHAAKASGAGWDRSARAQRVSWIDDTPVIGAPLSLDTLVPLPSGETVNRILLQAEDGALTQGAQIVDGPAGGKAVHFERQAESCTITVRAPAAGQYAIYIRHSNAGLEESAIWVSLNGGGNRRIPATRAGVAGQFTMNCIVLPLEEGLNAVALSAGPDVDIDLVIFDKTPVTP